MITIKHIEIYKKYDGDGDGFTHCATPEEKMIMDYKYWSLIDTFIQDLFIIKKGLASTTFIRSINEKLKENCDSESTIIQLKDIV